MELEKARALKQRLARGESAIGAQVAFTDSSVVEILGRAGYDWIAVDAEHSPQTPQTMKAMLQAGVPHGAVIFARPLKLDPDLIRLYLDLGAQGILCPFVETAEQARSLVDSCRYPPAGKRGYGPRRAGLHGLDAQEYFELANESILCVPMIESQTTVDNIDEIVSVDGIDGVCIGPQDMSISLGVHQQFDDERYVGAVEKVRQACKRYGKAMGTGTYSLDHARASLDHGDQIIIALGDDGALVQGAIENLAALR